MKAQHMRQFIVIGALITCVVAVPNPAVGSSGINLLGPNGNATIVYDGDFTGVVGTGVADPLDEIYDSDFSPSLTPIGPREVDCAASWYWEQILCDPSPTTDDSLTLTKLDDNNAAGATFYNDAAATWYAYYVIDLGSIYSLSNLQVFQMFSDGKITHVGVEGHPQTGNTRPEMTDAGWFTMLAKSFVDAGTENSGSPRQVTDPTSYSLGGVSTRYVLLKFWNDGIHGNASYIEVGGVKLFGGADTSPPSSPQRQVFELAFTPTDGTVCANTSQLGLAGAWMTLPSTNDCAPPATKPDAKLLDWATSPDFPVAIAKRQVDNGWGVYETFNDEGRLTSVFIPAGGSTLVSAAGNLFAIWSD